MANKLKPSEAMLLGMKRSRPCVGYMYREGTHQGHPQACALGAIALGYGFTKDEIGIDDDKLSAAQIDSRLTRRVDHPAYVKAETYSLDLGEAIVELNDDHQWSRKKIANWLQKLGL